MESPKSQASSTLATSSSLPTAAAFSPSAPIAALNNSSISHSSLSLQFGGTTASASSASSSLPSLSDLATPSVSIIPCDYDPSISPIKEIMARAYSRLDRKIGDKCVGVMQVEINQSEVFYILSISGNGVNNYKPDEMAKRFNNTHLQVLRSEFKDGKIIVHVAEFDAVRSIYGDVKDKTYFANLAAKSRDEFALKYLQQTKAKISDLGHALHAKEVNVKDEKALSALNERVKEFLEKHTLWSQKIKNNPNLLFPADFEVVVHWFTQHIIGNKELWDKFYSMVRSPVPVRLQETVKGAVIAIIYSIADRINGDSKAIFHELKQAAVNGQTDAGRNEFADKCKQLKVHEFEEFCQVPPCTFANLLGCYFGVLEGDPRSTQLADFVARCAEDNASTQLIEILESIKSRVDIQSICIRWYSVRRIDHEADVSHFALCPVCAVRFVERLRELILTTLQK